MSQRGNTLLMWFAAAVVALATFSLLALIISGYPSL